MSTSLINQFLSELKAGNENEVMFCDPAIVKADELGDILSAYRECAEHNGLMEVVFTYADRDGSLSTVDENGVEIMLLKDDILQDLEYYNAFYKDSFLAKDFSVRIKSIDEETRTVYVRSSRTTHNSTRNRLSREIQERLARGEMVRIAGRPRRVDPDRAYVDILCKGILGVCMVNNWQKGFTRYLQEECQTDMIYDFVVTGKLNPVPGKPAAYALSRVPFTREPWDGVDAGYNENDVIILKCISVPEGKSYWWGKSKMVDGIDVMCDYNDKFRIVEGKSYKCKIKTVDEESRIFKAVPFEALDGDPQSGSLVRFIERQRVRTSRSRR